VTFDLTLQDLIDIATDECPIFHTKFVWGSSGLGKGKTRNDTPQLDKIFPEFGYIKGNIAFLSAKANKMKDNGTMQDHYDIADWIWSHTHVKQESTTPVPAGDYQQGEIYPELGSFSTTGTWQDDNNSNHHSGAVQGQDADHSTKASSGDSLGRGSQEMEPSIVAQSIEATWPREPKIIWIADRGGHIPDKP
jgi:hypothetical protein